MRRFLVSAVCFLLGSHLLAQTNSVPNLAANFQWGQKLLTYENGVATQAWFFAPVVAGRSYCAETGNVESFTLSEKQPNTALVVFGHDTTTAFATNDDVTNEPRARFLSRVCWIPALTEDNFVELVVPSTTYASYIQIRFLETTLYCPWFFIAGDYNAFSLIRNTSNTALSGVVVTWRGLNGTVAGTTTVTVPANGTFIVNARDFVSPALFSNGSIEIAHAGAPDQLKGSTTTLSGTTGLGFDALFEQRKTW
ncbi:MAG: hypothetical protein ABI592_05040 [Acidobacteriota bacterium]